MSREVCGSSFYLAFRALSLRLARFLASLPCDGRINRLMNEKQGIPAALTQRLFYSPISPKHETNSFFFSSSKYERYLVNRTEQSDSVTFRPRIFPSFVTRLHKIDAWVAISQELS